MAIVLKSNKTATGEFNKYMTPIGVVNKLTYEFYLQSELDGSTLDENQLSALNIFEQRLIDENIINKVREIYPFIGSTFNALLIKMRGINNNKLLGLNTLNSTENGDEGKGIYLEGRTSVSKGLNTSITIEDIKNGFDLFLYYKPLEYSNPSVFFGVGNNLADSKNMICYATSDKKLGFSNNNNAVVSSENKMITGDFNIYNYSINALDGLFSQRRVFVNNTIVFSNDTSSSLPVTPESIVLGATASIGTTGGPFYGLKGHVRFGVITENLNTTERILMNSIISEFCVNQGKNV